MSKSYEEAVVLSQLKEDHKAILQTVGNMRPPEAMAALGSVVNTILNAWIEDSDDRQKFLERWISVLRVGQAALNE